MTCPPLCRCAALLRPGALARSFPLIASYPLTRTSRFDLAPSGCCQASADAACSAGSAGLQQSELSLVKPQNPQSHASASSLTSTPRYRSQRGQDANAVQRIRGGERPQGSECLLARAGSAMTWRSAANKICTSFALRLSQSDARGIATEALANAGLASSWRCSW